MVVTVSSGVGGKIFDRAHPAGVLDDPFYAGEIGHLVVDDSIDAPICDCGVQGHLGAIASGRGIEREAARRAIADPGAFGKSLCVTRLGATPENLTNEEHIVPAARAGDAWALDVVRDCSRPLAKILATIMLAAGLDRIIVIGGFALVLSETYLSLLREAFARVLRYDVLPGDMENRLELGDANEEACLLGAGEFFKRRLRNPR
uniref:Glucokinase n=1 Tax=Candidatus Kentrum sp. FM TaxID=2126340 RepID=A0A450WWM9_9GAMM|nr:MAG: glucokinase [Candidatus Kentron sp. FM]VFJ76586.1 MAG: glucokinase [Candidatus Kentron sp. FM]VFK21379.1 MAG: glucokinase [Candidatus Kentron sp. FM]